MTDRDIDQIVEGIEQFIMNGDPEVDAIWQPYIDKLNELKGETNVENAIKTLTSASKSLEPNSRGLARRALAELNKAFELG